MSGVKTIGSCFGISKKTEVLLMTLFSVCCNIFDMSLLELGTNIEQIWSLTMDGNIFPEKTQHNIKSFLSAVVLIRSFTLHLYITLSIAMLWPALNGNRPGICVPWLLVSGIKNIVTSVLAFAAGVFVCAMYGGYRPACMMFAFGQICNVIPSIYMWTVVFSYYRDLTKPKPIDALLSEKMEEMEMLMAVRRRKVRSLTTEAVLRKEIENRRKYTGTSALGLEDFFKPDCWENVDKGSRSLDSLLEVMANEEDFQDAEEEPQEELDVRLTPQQKTMKLLGITQSQVNLAKSTRVTPKDKLPRMKLKHPKSMYLSEPASKINRPGTSGTIGTDGSTHVKQNTIRTTKSELKSLKEITKLDTPIIFMNSIPETEIRTISIHSLHDSCKENSFSSDDDDSYKNLKKKLSGQKSKLPRRVWNVPEFINLEQFPSYTKTKSCLKKAKREDHNKRNVNGEKNTTKKPEVANNASTEKYLEEKFRTEKHLEDKTKHKTVKAETVKKTKDTDELKLKNKNRSKSKTKKSTKNVNNIDLDDTKASTNISINCSEKDDSFFTPQSESESSAYIETKNMSQDFNNLKEETKTEESFDSKMCQSVDITGLTLPVNEFPIFLPVALNGTPQGYLETKVNFENQCILPLKYKKESFTESIKLEMSTHSCEVLPHKITRLVTVSAQTTQSCDQISSVHTNTSKHIIFASQVDGPKNLVTVETNTSSHQIEQPPEDINDLNENSSLCNFLKIVEEKSKSNLAYSDKRPSTLEECAAKETAEILNKLNDKTIRKFCHKLITAIGYWGSQKTDYETQLMLTPKAINIENIPPLKQIEENPLEKETILIHEIKNELDIPKDKEFNLVEQNLEADKTDVKKCKKIQNKKPKDNKKEIEVKENPDDYINILNQNTLILNLLPNTSIDTPLKGEGENIKIEEYDAVGAALPPLPEIVTLSEFGCQASTLSRKILASPPEEISKALHTTPPINKKRKTKSLNTKPTISASRHVKLSLITNQEKLKTSLVHNKPKSPPEAPKKSISPVHKINASTHVSHALHIPLTPQNKTLKTKSKDKRSSVHSDSRKISCSVIKYHAEQARILSPLSLECIDSDNNQTSCVKIFTKKKRVKPANRIK